MVRLEVRDLLIDFGDGQVKKLLDLNNVEFVVIQNLVAQHCLIVHDGVLGQDASKRIEIECLIRSNPKRYSHNDNTS